MVFEMKVMDEHLIFLERQPPKKRLGSESSLKDNVSVC